MQQLLTILFLLLMPIFSSAASFDCGKAKSVQEKLICSDASLSKIDTDLAGAYKTALASTSYKEDVKKSQLQWIKRRRDCVDVNCLLQLYQNRMVELTDFVKQMQQTHATELKAKSKEETQSEEDLNEVYKQLLSLSSAQQKLELEKQQQQWLEMRNKAGSKHIRNYNAQRIQDLGMQVRSRLVNTAFKSVFASKEYKPELFLAELKSCDHVLCNAYKAYFLFPQDSAQAYELLHKSIQQGLTKKASIPVLAEYPDTAEYAESSLEEIKQKYKNQTAIAVMLSHPEIARIYGTHIQFGIPLIVAKHTPEALLALEYRDASIDAGAAEPSGEMDAALPTMSKLHDLNQLLHKIETGGNSVDIETSGTIVLDHAAAWNKCYRILMVAPQLFYEKHEYLLKDGALPMEQALKPLETWSHLSTWNKTQYKEFLKKFNAAADELARYYQTIPELRSYAAQAKQTLALYVYWGFPSSDF